MKEELSADEILREYKNGRRDFSGIKAIGIWFTDVDLRKIIFRNAKLDFTSFRISLVFGGLT